MNLCIDVGNTTIGMGFFQNGKLIKRVTYTLDIKKTCDEYISIIRNIFKENDYSFSSLEKIILSSVVPSVNDPLTNALKELFSIEPMRIAPGIKTGLTIHVDNPNEIGNDLIAVMVGAKEQFGYPLLIADLGTASKILLVDKTGAFVSCVIMPGLSLSMDSLTNRAALLPEISLKDPKTIMAKNTVDAINTGVVYGHADMISGIIKRYEKQLGYKCKHVLTGGGAIYIRSVLGDEFIYDPDICLKGLELIIERNEVSKNEK